MSGFPWWAWAILAAVVGFFELHVPGSYLIWIALGAALTAVLEVTFGLGFPAQIETFIVACALSCLVGYFVYRHLDRAKAGEDVLNERNRSLIGARGIVAEAFSNGSGKVRLGDTVWLAEGPDLGAGIAVTVTAVRGARLIVERGGPDKA